MQWHDTITALINDFIVGNSFLWGSLSVLDIILIKTKNQNNTSHVYV